jgi:predicted nucleic acid-binding protein
VSLVVDASAAAEFLLRTPIGEQVAAAMGSEELLAPELLDVEVASVLRKGVQRGALGRARAEEALSDLYDWDLERISHRSLLAGAWALRDNVTVYDAMYLALARLHGAALLTADGPLARVPLRGFVIHNVRASG